MTSRFQLNKNLKITEYTTVFSRGRNENHFLVVFVALHSYHKWQHNYVNIEFL